MLLLWFSQVQQKTFFFLLSLRQFACLPPTPTSQARNPVWSVHLSEGGLVCCRWHCYWTKCMSCLCIQSALDLWARTFLTQMKTTLCQVKYGELTICLLVCISHEKLKNRNLPQEWKVMCQVSYLHVKTENWFACYFSAWCHVQASVKPTI